MSVSSFGSKDVTCPSRPSTVGAFAVVIVSLGLSFEADDQHALFVANSDLMSKKAPERELRGSELTAATAEKSSAGKTSTSMTANS
jgi:hypothetical protein